MTEQMFEFLLFRRALRVDEPNNGEHEKMIELIQEFLRPHTFELVGRKVSIFPGQGVKPSLIAALREWYTDAVLEKKTTVLEKLQEAVK